MIEVWQLQVNRTPSSSEPQFSDCLICQFLYRFCGLFISYLLQKFHSSTFDSAWAQLTVLYSISIKLLLYVVMYGIAVNCDEFCVIFICFECVWFSHSHLIGVVYVIMSYFVKRSFPAANKPSPLGDWQTHTFTCAHIHTQINTLLHTQILTNTLIRKLDMHCWVTAEGWLMHSSSYHEARLPWRQMERKQR